jgi:hypothetical protein
VAGVLLCAVLRSGGALGIWLLGGWIWVAMVVLGEGGNDVPSNRGLAGEVWVYGSALGPEVAAWVYVAAVHSVKVWVCCWVIALQWSEAGGGWSCTPRRLFQVNVSRSLRDKP